MAELPSLKRAHGITSEGGRGWIVVLANGQTKVVSE